MLTFIVGLVAFIYLVFRINGLSSEINNLKNKSSVGTNKILSGVPTPSPTLSNIPIAPSPVTTSPSISAVSVDKKNDVSEFNIGGKVFTVVGAIAVLIGIGFFFRYAFENNIITPGMRVLLGVVTGIALSVGGNFLRKKYDSYGSVLFGTGLGILYVSIYSAYSFYGLIDLSVASFLLVVVTSLGVAISLYYNSLPLVSFSFAGAFIVPFILPISSSVHILFVYISILTLSVLVVSFFKNWVELTLGSLFGSSLVILKFLATSYNDTLSTVTCAYITLVFLMFFFTNLKKYLSSPENQEKPGQADSFLIFATPVIYVLLNLFIFHAREDIAVLVFFVSLFYLGGSVLIRILLSGNKFAILFSNIMLVLGSLALLGATALHFEGSSVTILWALEAIGMVVVGYLLCTSYTRILGIVLSVLTFLHLIFSDLNISATQAIFNERAVICLVVSIMFGVLWYVYRVATLQGLGGEAEMTTSIREEQGVGNFIFALGLFATPFLWICVEVNQFVTHPFLYMPLAWMIYLSIAIGLGFVFKDKILRIPSYVLFLVSIMVTVVSLWELPTDMYQPLINLRVLTALVCALVVAYVIYLFKIYSEEVTKEELSLRVALLIAGNGILLWAGSLEIANYFESTHDISNESVQRVSLSVFWLFYAIIGLWAGIVRRSIFARYLALALFAVVILKVFLYDSLGFTDVYRFVSFIMLGVILLVAGYSYFRFRERITSFVNAEEK